MRPDQLGQRRPAALISCILGLLTVLSCSAHAQSVVLQLPPDDQQMITAQLGPSVVGKAVPSKPIDDTSIYFPLHDSASIYQVMAGPNVGKTQALGLTRMSALTVSLHGASSSRPRSPGSSVRRPTAI